MRDVATSIHRLPKLLEVAEGVKRYPQGRTLALAHLLDPEMLQAGYHRIRKGAAVGVDGVDKEQYGQDLDRKINDLHERLRTGRYRHQPIRRVHIPKAPGKTRPIGISTVEDKVVQNALSAVLQAVYEPVFSTSSYGFRPGRRAHDAIAALDAAAMGGQTRWVLEADIQTFFDSIDCKVADRVPVLTNRRQVVLATGRQVLARGHPRRRGLQRAGRGHRARFDAVACLGQRLSAPRAGHVV